MDAKWLNARLGRDIRYNVLLGNLTLTGAVLILTATWYLAYLVAFFLLRPRLGWFHWSYLAFATLAVPALFVGYVRSSSSERDTPEAMLRPRGAIINPFSSRIVRSMGNIFTDAVYFGPQLVFQGLDRLQKAKRLSEVEETLCAKVIDALHRSSHSVSLKEVEALVGAEKIEKILEQVEDIDGVARVGKEREALALSTRFREEIDREAAG